MLASKRMAKVTLLMMTVAIIAILMAAPVAAQLLLDDSLQGSTSGTRSGGTFANGGWQVTGTEDYIYWHLPYSVSHGAAEFYVKGVNPNQPEKNEHFHMYDYTYNNSDTSYSPGYRENPYKMFIRKSGVNDGAKANSCEIVYQITGTDPNNFFEMDTTVLSWDPATNYKMRVEWGPEGSQTRCRIFRDGVEIINNAVNGTYLPTGHAVRVGKARGMGEGAQINAVYSNLKVWDMTNNVPSAPTVTSPSNGSTVKSGLAFIKWTGDSHDRYQVRVCTANDPNSGIAWDSGETFSSRDWAWTGSLGNLTNYYVFVKIGTSSGYSSWSANGHSFTVDNGYNGSNNVLVNGYSLRDNNGPFLGIGFSHMRALNRCKYDRARYMSDLADMSSKGFKFQRILSMVAWSGLEIAPISFGSVPAWSDYWQQFRDAIDIAYDSYGIRTEITIFADAQIVMPNSADRYAHCSNVLANLVGREHKVIQIEVANESWQNGFSNELDCRTFAQYLADRTNIPISNSSPSDSSSDAAIQAMYTGSAADISNVHLTRDTSEGGWYAVRDSWRLGSLYPSIPPGNSNEPIGPQSSVAQENDPTRLMASAAFCWISGSPMYVYHGRFGTSGIDMYDGHDVYMRDTPGFSSFQYLAGIIPGDVASWIRNDGKESAAPFTAYCNGQANKYWTDIGGASSGCHRNIGARNGNEFICLTQGVLGGGVTLEARQQLTFKVFNPMTGGVVIDTVTKNAGDQITLGGSPNTYIIWGGYGPSLPTGGGGSKTLTSRGATTITIDGATSDWALSDFTDRIRGGQSGAGDTALVGWDGSTCYYGSYASGTVLPTNAADHTAKIYSRNDASYLYFLVRCDDNDMRYSNPASANYANDCVEFYIDPANAGGSSAISNSTSDIQLVIDANNQKNVYMTTGGYATQILNGLTSAVVRDATGWWLEARLSKTALDPDISAGQTVGLDFNFRDNDNNNDAAVTTVYTWADSSYSGFPSKIPNNWGDCFLDANQTPYSGTISLPGTIQAENYDVGGNNISYYDTTSGNEGGDLRSDGVDISTTTDTGGGYCVGWTVAGEWLEYTVSVSTTGDYSISTRVATPSTSAGFKLQMDGADITGATTFANTGGWQNWTSIICPSVYLTSGTHILRFRCETGDFNINSIDVTSRGTDAVSMDLGSPDIQDGMTHIQVADGDTIPWTVAGHNCRENVGFTDTFMYFGVTDIYAYNGNKPDIYITCDYYDIGTATLGLDYDSTSSAYQHVNGPTLTNTQTWKSYTFHVTNAYFGNRENGGADFRFTISSQQEWGIDTVVVYQGADTTPPSPVSSLVVAAGDTQNVLTWINPSDADFTGTMIRFKTTGYPTGITDGTQVYNSSATSYTHTGLTNGTTYYYSAYAHDGGPNYAAATQASGVPHVLMSVVNVKTAANLNLVIDGSSSDWNLAADFTTKARGGQEETGDYAIVGYDNGVCYRGSYVGTLPLDAADHTGKVYSRHDQQYLYFLVRCDDSDIQYPEAASVNWANDCVEFYIDPSNDHGSSTMSNSTSDVQLVIDANNQKNVYMATSGYATQVLNGVTSAVVRDSSGWWLEAKISKAAIDPDVANSGTIGLDFNFRDNDNLNDASLTTVYAWRESSTSGYPSKIPSHWGDGSLASLASDTTAPAAVTGFTATPGVLQVSLVWTNPTTADWAGTKIMFKTTGYPTGPTDGTQAYNGTASSYTHTSLADSTTYYYKAFAFDEVPNYATAAQASATTNDTTPPANVTAFTVTPRNQENDLAWTNPVTADFTGTMIRFKTTGYPTSTADGTLIYNSNGTSYNHTGLANGTTYYYKAFSHDVIPNYASGVTGAGVPVSQTSTLNVKSAANLNLVIDGNSSDWNLAADFVTKALGGLNTVGDMAIVGFDGGTCYRGSYAPGTVLPTNAADHTAKVYSYHDQQYLYFLVRCDDSDMQYSYASGSSWANDCVEFYIDPSHDHGSNTMSNSTSDIQLVIDANNQKNVYMTTSGYATQVLNGVTSAVVRDSTGWWVEAKILKSALDSDIPNSGSTGVDFNFRDNDNNNDAALTTVYAWRESSTAGYPSKIPDHWGDASLATLASDTTAPAPATGFTATGGDTQVNLAWTNPVTADWAGTMVRFKTTGYPTSAADGTQIYNGTGTSYTHTTLTNGTTYYYGVYTYDEVPNYSTAVQDNAIPADVTPPGAVTSFTATPGNAQNSLSWTNPGGDFTGTKIVFKTSGYPVSPSDGTQCYDGSGTSTNHTGLTNGVTYYYSAYAHDEVPNYASVVQAQGQPTNIATISNSTFDSDANGWSVTYWRNGTVDGAMAWNSGAGSSGGGMRYVSSGATDSDDKCTREGTELQKTISTSGYSNIKVQYDLRVNSLGQNWTGAGIGGNCPVDHSLIDDQITVYYSTNGGSSWTEAENVQRAALLATYQSYGTRTINLTSVTACNNNANFRLRFRWQMNCTTDTVDLDNIKVTSN
jgi:hypothetical protein